MSGARGFRGFLQRFFFPDVETLLTSSEELDRRLDRVDKNVGALDKNIGALDKNVGSLDASLALLVDQGLARLNDGMRKLDENMGLVHKGMVQLNLGMDQLNKDTDEREKDLSTRLSVLKAKLQDDHSRAMGEIAALLEEHAYIEREEGALKGAQAVHPLRPQPVPHSQTAATPPVAVSAAVAPQIPAQEATPPQVALPSLAAAPPHFAGQVAAPFAAGASAHVPVGPVSSIEAGVPYAHGEDSLEDDKFVPSARISPAPVAIPSRAQEQEAEFESRAEALADPIATLNRLSAIFGRAKGSDALASPPNLETPQGAGAALDFAAILEGIKRSGMREVQASTRPESRAL